jgi:putative endopeptidase
MKGSKIPETRPFPESGKTAPCENFHKYVCEEVESRFKLPADRSAWSFSFTDNSERLLHAKKAFFRKISEGFIPEGPRIGQLKNFYLSCMNESASANEEREIVRKERKSVLDLKTLEELQDLSASRIDQPELSFVNSQNLPDQKDPSRNDLIVIGQLMSLPERSYYDNKTAVKDLTALAEAFFKELKLDRPGERAKWVADFEKAMAQKFPLPAEIRDRVGSDTYRPREHFLSSYPNLRLSRFLNRVPTETRIRDLAPEALSFLNASLAEMPLEKLQSIYLFHSLKDQMDDGYPAFYRKMFEFDRKHLGGPTKRPARDERCTKLVMRSFSHELDEYLTPVLFPGFPREKVVSLVSKIRTALVGELDRNEWLSKAAKNEAKRKMDTAKLFLVQPSTEKEWDFNPVQEYSLTESRANRKKLRLANINKGLEELKAARPRERWAMGPLTLNAYYMPSDNQFVLLQGILQYPFFSPEASEIENLGAIGSVVGHELGHGIDDNGSRYDADGKLRQWMTEKDLKEFQSRGAKFVARFDAIGHNGKLTLGENIGDHVGLRSAYLAAFSGTEKASLGDKQKFFKAYAKLWCQVARPEFETMLLKTDAHSLDRARINEQVIHMDGFYEAFSCKNTDKMFIDPKDRIRIW